MEEQDTNTQKTEELPEWLQPDEDGLEPGVDISVEEAEDIAKFLQEELGLKINS